MNGTPAILPVSLRSASFVKAQSDDDSTLSVKARVGPLVQRIWNEAHFLPGPEAFTSRVALSGRSALTSVMLAAVSRLGNGIR